jgi:hypothetical protein
MPPPLSVAKPLETPKTVMSRMTPPRNTVEERAAEKRQKRPTEAQHRDVTTCTLRFWRVNYVTSSLTGVILFSGIVDLIVTYHE